MVRVCVVGMDEIGLRHAEAYRGDDRAELVAVCDPVRERAGSASERLGVPAFYDLREMLRIVRPDLCSVCLTETGPEAPIMEALASGAHVLGVPPLSEEAVSKAREMGLCLAADLPHRFTPYAVKARAWIEEDRLGTLLFINMSLWTGDGDGDTLFRSSCSHAVDLMRYCCGEVRDVQCFGTSALGTENGSSVQINMQFENEVVGNLTASCDMSPHHPVERCEVTGTRARLVIDNVFEELTLYPHASEEKTVLTNSIFGGVRGFDDICVRRIHRLLEHLVAGDPMEEIEAPGADAVAAQRVVDAAVASLAEGCVVNVPTSLEETR